MGNINRRQFLKTTAAAMATGLGMAPGCGRRFATPVQPKVIVIGFDGMDPRLCAQMMENGRLPNLDRLREAGGYHPLGTSIPPQSPVAWASFINGAGPGSHGIFDFIHRDPAKQCAPYFSAAETLPGSGYWEFDDYRLQLDFWPFDHQPPRTVLRRMGTPFWDYLDQVGIPSVFYDLPSNYPPSSSKYGNHRCLAGMGTPDLLGTYGTYQHYAENAAFAMKNEGGGKRFRLVFENDTAKARLMGPPNTLLKKPRPTEIDFLIHRDPAAKAAVIEIQERTLLLKQGQWSDWTRIQYPMQGPALLPEKKVHGICRFYLQQVEPEFKLYVSPINCDPSQPEIRLTEPPGFIETMADDLGLFYTTGFQEDHKALSNKIFSDDEFVHQAHLVLEERLKLLDYALTDYNQGLLFFYFSSTDLQSHMLWWDSDAPHPVRSAAAAKTYFDHIKDLYRRMDQVVGRIVKQYGDEALIMVMSDHGFARFERQFHLNAWLRENGYLGPSDASSLFTDVNWRQTRAYGLGINSLYLNLRGREAYGIVNPGPERESLMQELTARLEDVKDKNGRPVVRKVHRTDQIFRGAGTAMAPDLIIGYARPYRAAWDTCLGGMGDDVLSDNHSAWSADHCADVSEVPGVLFCNRKIKKRFPALIDLAPSILQHYGLEIPPQMEGRSVFG